MEIWQVVLAAIATGAALIATTVFTGLKDIIATWFQRLNKKIKKRTYVQQVEKLAEFLEVFEGMKNISAIQRCIVLHGHNCGGLPTPGRPYTVRAIHGWVTKPGKANPVEKYNFELQVDMHYVRLLEDVIKTGYSIQEFNLIPDSAKLKMLYEIDGVKYARLYFIGIIDEELLFLSASTFDGPAFDHATCLQIQWAIDRMKSLVNGD